MRRAIAVRRLLAVAMATGLELVPAWPALAVPCSLTCPENLTRSAEADKACNAATVTFPPPTFVGSCGPITCTPPSGSTFPLGMTTVTCTSGSAMCAFSVQVLDQPILKCLDEQFMVPLAPVAIDYMLPQVATACSPLQSLTCDPPPGTYFRDGTTEVKCTAVNTAGRSSMCIKFITVDAAVIRPTEPAPAMTIIGLGGLAAALVGLGTWSVRRRRARQRCSEHDA